MAPHLTGAVLCVACYNEQPAKDHVDFQAEVDRGWYAEGTDKPVPLDELILCEDCVKAGARLLGMESATLRSAHIKDLQIQVDRLERQLKQAENYAARMEDLAKDHFDERLQQRKPRRKEPVHG